MTQETLQAENAELKRKLAEAEQWRKTHEVCHDKWDGLQSRLAEAERAKDKDHDLMLSELARAEAAERKLEEHFERVHGYESITACEAVERLGEYAEKLKSAERERDGYERMLSMAHEQRDINRDRAEQAERKCAELSEALRWMDRKGGLGLDVHERIKAALASQPAPEAKGCDDRLPGCQREYRHEGPCRPNPFEAKPTCAACKTGNEFDYTHTCRSVPEEKHTFAILARLFNQEVLRHPRHTDHACRLCPGATMVQDGFICAYHEAEREVGVPLNPTPEARDQ
jgi:hypothetical protein